MLRNILIYFMLYSTLSTMDAQDISITMLSSYDVATMSSQLDFRSKKKIVDRINIGNYKPVFNGISNPRYFNEPLLCISGQKEIFTFDIINNTSKVLSDISIEISLESNNSPRLYQQALLNDHYSSKSKKKNLLRYKGDALILISDSNVGKTNLRPFEKIRVVLEFVPVSKADECIDIHVTTDENSEAHNKIFLNVQTVREERSKINSIIFNHKGLQSGANAVALWQDIGFTHLQVTHVPSMTFDESGEPQESIDAKTKATKGFNRTAIPWLRKGGKVMLFWPKKYKSMAPIFGTDTYLIPFTEPWYTALDHLINATIEYTRGKVDSFNPNQFVLYVCDEFSSQKGHDAHNYLQLARFIKSHHPAIKTFVTFGNYTSESDVEQLTPELDLTCLNFRTPQKDIVKKNKVFKPYLLDQKWRSTPTAPDQKWAYLVGKGRSSHIREFILFPLMAAAKGDRGFSWWAFAAHRGSSWKIGTQKGFNYSLYYQRDNKDEIYNMWSYGQEKTKFVPSMRLLGIRKGLRVANYLIQAIEEKQSLSDSDRLGLDRILEKLNAESKNNSDPNNMTLTEIEDLHQDITALYINLNK